MKIFIFSCISANSAVPDSTYKKNQAIRCFKESYLRFFYNSLSKWLDNLFICIII